MVKYAMHWFRAAIRLVKLPLQESEGEGRRCRVPDPQQLQGQNLANAKAGARIHRRHDNDESSTIVCVHSLKRFSCSESTCREAAQYEPGSGKFGNGRPEGTCSAVDVDPLLHAKRTLRLRDIEDVLTTAHQTLKGAAQCPGGLTPFLKRQSSADTRATMHSSVGVSIPSSFAFLSGSATMVCQGRECGQRLLYRKSQSSSTNLDLHRAGCSSVHAHGAVDTVLDCVSLDEACQVLFLDLVTERLGNGIYFCDDSLCDDGSRVRCS